VDMNDRLCSNGPVCSVVVGGAIVYKDDDHITASFSRHVAPVLGDRISDAVRGLAEMRDPR